MRPKCVYSPDLSDVSTLDQMVKGTVKVTVERQFFCCCFDGLSEVGDFGLATSSLAGAVEPTELASHAITVDAELTLGSLVVSRISHPHCLSQRLGLNSTLRLKCNHQKRAREIIQRLICIVSG